VRKEDLMVKIKLPYGERFLRAEIPDNRLEGIMISKANDFRPNEPEAEIVRKALTAPVAGLPLRKMAEGKDKIVIITSDHTRPMPSRLTMPLLLEEIRKGNPKAEVCILIATGFHRPTTENELRQRFGNDIVDREKIVVHDCTDESMLKTIGRLSSGVDLKINKLAFEADLLAAEGFIEPHFFAGFSGGRKSILPGVAGRKSIMANHAAGMINDPRSRTGVLTGNPIHEEMVTAAGTAGLAFILNVVINKDKRIIKAFSGHYNHAHLAGCEFLAKEAGVQSQPADIVITTNGGYPLDQNIYQTVKCMTAAEATCRENGVIIVASECRDGHGGDSFFQTFARAAHPRDVLEEIIKRSPEETIPDQWEAQILARILIKHRVIMATGAPREMVESMHMKWAPSVESAIDLAGDLLGNNKGNITVIPDGVGVIVR